MGMIGDSPQILLAIALIGGAAIAYTVVNLLVVALILSQTNASDNLIAAMRSQTILCKPSTGRWWSRWGELGWYFLVFAVPCMIANAVGNYVSSPYTFWYLLAIGVAPSVLAWIALRKSEFLSSKKSALSLAGMALAAFMVVTTAFLIIYSIKFSLIWLEKDYKYIELSIEIFLIIIISIVSAFIFSPSESSSGNIKIKIASVFAVVFFESFFGFNPTYVVRVAFELFASGGEHRTYTTLTEKALAIPRNSCLDIKCTDSKEVIVAADLGKSLYAYFIVGYVEGKPTKELRKVDTTGMTYKVIKKDPVEYGKLQLL